MITKFVERWEKNKDAIAESFRKGHPSDYADIVKTVITNITADAYGDFCPNPELITCIDDGHYQGTLLFIIAEKGYQPDDYYFVKVNYGSCSGCDTLEAIRGYSDNLPTEEQVKDYMTLALHIVQGLKRLEGESV